MNDASHAISLFEPLNARSPALDLPSEVASDDVVGEGDGDVGVLV